jgi:hypothetical protein
MDESFWEEVERSRRLTPQQRFLGTFAISDLARKLVMAGIRRQFPDADEQRVLEIFADRCRLARELDLMPI